MGKEKWSEDIPLIYLWIYKKFCDKWGECNIIVYSTEMREVVRRAMPQVPKKYDYFILKEMEKFGLIEIINIKKYKLLAYNANSKLKKLDQCFIFITD